MGNPPVAEIGGDAPGKNERGENPGCFKSEKSGNCSRYHNHPRNGVIDGGSKYAKSGIRDKPDGHRPHKFEHRSIQADIVKIV